MKKIVLAALCFVSFNAFSSQVVPEGEIKKKKEELDATLKFKAIEHLNDENAKFLARDINAATPRTAKRSLREQAISRMANSIQTETAKVFPDADILGDLNQRKIQAQQIIESTEPEMKEMQQQHKEDKEKAARQQALKQKWCCCWRLCDSD